MAYNFFFAGEDLLSQMGVESENSESMEQF